MQFQSIMTTNRVLDKIVGLNRRGSLKDLKEDLIEKSDNLVHQKNIIQLNSQIFQTDSAQGHVQIARPMQIRRSVVSQKSNSMVGKGSGHRRPMTVDMDEEREFSLQQSWNLASYYV